MKDENAGVILHLCPICRNPINRRYPNIIDTMNSTMRAFDVKALYYRRILKWFVFGVVAGLVVGHLGSIVGLLLRVGL